MLILAASIQLIYFFVLFLLKPFIGKKGMLYIKSFIMVFILFLEYYDQGEYLRFARFILSDFKLVLTGDVDKLLETKDKRSIYIQNHITELDWIFVSYFLQVFGRESDFSAVMKGSIGQSLIILLISRKLPALGYVVKDLGMCLLDRNWEKDQKHFKDFIDVFENHPRPLCVFLCPEGTTVRVCNANLFL